jgi:hypothetical protein
MPRLSAACVCLVLAAWGIADYPLPSWLLLGPLAVYAVALWRWPGSFLLILPIALPAFDLGLWTGWMMIGESDLAVLVTLAILLIRVSLDRRDLAPRERGSWTLAALTGLWVLATVIGRMSPLGAGPSDNAFLRPDNALRLAKGLAEALALMPFLINRQRSHGDAVLRLGHGIAAGLVVVTLLVLAERVLYCGLFDFSGDYRVAGPFSSMRVGGGHIGAYAALALPFTLALLTLRPRHFAVAVTLGGLIAGGYTLAATLARTAFAAGAAGMLATGFAMICGRDRRSAAPVGIFAVLLVVGGLVAVTAFTGMRARFAETAGDFSTREGNWQAGLAVRDTGVVPTLVGMGLGTYQRTMLVRSPVNRPSDIVLRRSGGMDSVEMRIETPFYFGQKVVPTGGPMHVRLQARAVDRPNAVGVSLCDKVLLYSDNCQGGELTLPSVARWDTLELTLPTASLGGGALGGLVHRVVELSIFGHRGRIEVRDVRLTDDIGREHLVNGNFSDGLNRWLFTDDSHVSWRILNVYLMLFFETGVLGLAAYLVLAGAAVFGALAAARSGVAGAAPIVGGITAFLVSGLFDNVLEAPRIATLFFLICICGLIAQAGDARPGVPLTAAGA